MNIEGKTDRVLSVGLASWESVILCEDGNLGVSEGASFDDVSAWIGENDAWHYLDEDGSIAKARKGKRMLLPMPEVAEHITVAKSVVGVAGTLGGGRLRGILESMLFARTRDGSKGRVEIDNRKAVALLDGFLDEDACDVVCRMAYGSCMLRLLARIEAVRMRVLSRHQKMVEFYRQLPSMLHSDRVPNEPSCIAYAQYAVVAFGRTKKKG